MYIIVGGKRIKSRWNSMSSTCANNYQETWLERIKFPGLFKSYL